MIKDINHRTEESVSISKQFVELMKDRNFKAKTVANMLLARESEIQKFYSLPKNKQINNEALYRIYFLADRVTDCVHCKIAEKLKKSCIEEIERRAN